jgi:hypothetical protein
MRLFYAAGSIEFLRQARQRLREIERVDVPTTIRRVVGLKAPPIFVGSASYPTGHEAAEALGKAALNAWDRSGAAGVIDTWTRATGFALGDGVPSSNSWGETGGPWGNSNGGTHALDALKHLARRLSRLRRHAPPDLSGRIEQEFWEAANDLPPDEGFYRWLAEHPEWQGTDGAQDAAGPQGKRPSCTRDEANAAAMKLAKADPQFVNGSVRKWAAAVRKATGTTCSTATVKLTRLWIRTMEISGRGRTKGKTPKAVALTGKVESVIGKGDKHQVLKDLIAEQTADDDDRPGTRRKPKQYKRV